MRHVYDKLDVHRRHEAVDRARSLGLLARAREAARPSEVPHLTREFIDKCLDDMRRLGLIPDPSSGARDQQTVAAATS